MTERLASKLRSDSAIGMASSHLERNLCSKTSPLIAATFLALRP